MAIAATTSIVDVLLVPDRLIAFNFRGDQTPIGVVIEYDLDGREQATRKLGHLVTVYQDDDYLELFSEVLEENREKGKASRFEISEEQFAYCWDFLRMGKHAYPRRVLREFGQLFPDSMQAYLHL